MTQTNSGVLAPTRGGLSAAILVGGAIALSTGTQLAVFGVGMLVASQHDIDRDQGVRASLVSIAVVAAVAAVIAFAVSLTCCRVAGRARVGAVALGALAVLSLPIFWAGAPAILGANAAWLGGLTKGGPVPGRVARGFGIVGFVVAVLNVVAILVLTLGNVLVVRGGYGS